MTCQPYNPIRDRSTAALRRLSVWLLLSGVQLAYSSTPLLAQCDCQPLWGPPVTPLYVLPDGMTYQALPPMTVEGPAWPVLPEAPQSITTNYAPAEESAQVLQQVPGAARLVISQSLLNRLLARNDTDAGPVTDVILGANVTGSQNTTTELSVHLLPCQQAARFEFQLTGTTFNQTIGVTPQAAVRSRGAHQFRVTKQVDFNGLTLTTRSPAAWVTPQLTNEGAATALTGVPLVGPLANQIAMNEAERRRPAAEQIITQRVTEQVAPRFNSEVDQQLAEGNVQLQQFLPAALAMVRLSPADLSVTSTNRDLLLGLSIPERTSAQIAPPHETARPILQAPVGVDAPSSESVKPAAGEEAAQGDDEFIIIRQIGDEQETNKPAQGNPAVAPAIVPVPRGVTPPPPFAAGQSMTLALHEQSINHLLDCIPLEGAEVPDRTIDRLLGHLVEVLTGTPLHQVPLDGLGSEDPEFATIVLHPDNPLTVRFEDGQLLIEAVAEFQPLLTPAVPAQRVQIPFTLTREGSQLSLVPGEVSVESLPGQAGGPMVELARPIIRQQITQRLQPLQLPTSVPLNLPDLPPLSLGVRDVTLTDGWLLIAFD